MIETSEIGHPNFWITIKIANELKHELRTNECCIDKKLNQVLKNQWQQKISDGHPLDMLELSKNPEASGSLKLAVINRN